MYVVKAVSSMDCGFVNLSGRLLGCKSGRLSASALARKPRAGAVARFDRRSRQRTLACAASEADAVPAREVGTKVSEAAEVAPAKAEASAELRRRLYVGNLDFKTEEPELGKHMGSVGVVKSVRILRKGNGKSVGAAIVEMESEDGAEEAKAQLHDTVLLGRKIFVREDREETKGKRAGHLDDDRKQRAIRLFNLPDGTTWQEIKDLGKRFGTVEFSVIHKTHDKGTVGTLIFESMDDAKTAQAKVDSSFVNGKKLCAVLATQPDPEASSFQEA